MMKSKKLVVYQIKPNGQFFIRATKASKNGKFAMKSEKYGKPLVKDATDAELGRSIREILKNCD